MRELAKKTMEWLVATKLLTFPRRIILKVVAYAIQSKHGVIILYNDPDRAKVIDLIYQIKQGTKMLLDDNEAYQIYMAVKRTKKIKGNIAEVGVYRGGSAKLICEAKGDKTLYLFDTFDGLPKVSKIDDSSQFHKGQFSALFEDVKDYLKEYPNVNFYKGLFSTTSEAIKNETFSFVNLDVDIYESTLSCIKFFYPRMSKGGIIISHDYISVPGVKKAFDDFFEDKPEPLIELSGTQCLITKI